jgi:hypothetical protein
MNRLNDANIEIFDNGACTRCDVEELLEIDTKVIVDLLVGMNT